MFDSILLQLTAVLAVVLIAQQLYHRYLARKWACGDILKVDQDYFGIWQARKLFADRNDGVDLQEQRNRFNRYHTETFRETLIGRELYYTSNLENIKAIVNFQFNDFSIGYRYPAFKPLLGDGIFATEGHKWKVAKEVLRPQFVREQIRDLDHLEVHIKNMAAIINNTHGQVFDIQDLFLRLTLDASTDFLFGESVSSLTKSEYEMGKYTFESAFNKVQKYIFARSILQSLYWTYNPKDFRECLNVIHTFTDTFVQKALSLTPEELDAKSKKNYTFLYELVKITRHRKTVHDHLLNIMLAGRNTTSALISSLMLELARNPECYEKLKKDVFENFGDGSDLSCVTVESMKKCNYLRYCINEALRMYPSVPQNFRCAKTATTLPRGGGPDGQDKIFLKKGQAVFMSFYTLQRSELYYGKDANEFNPDRWATIKNPGAFMPFLSGPRICLGQQFAIAEASYTILRIAQMFPNIKSFETEYPPRISANATMKLRDGVMVSLS
ncbi:hypothetical protein PSN45_000416 [Yamadazyma tenuis]|uniref:Cytochrome P450 n=1 Tax=Candida tenuis (strain ATCC 10573 / BCRC 21748 / CBS 615 / JCM 9827 / NBRC 10315 / NRRL Y-1498 / VKM Y-70) TaxID=590646 RepID=G3B8A7_CANTC|nr:cytochrome P450 [Yamadazyma tenuis ATCC 10573]EGV61726.1 cytochrome P450 [Yamadazyma tenuis ATCC 10573]WEJ92958.1 hypothetical protein PSN45_000416 [Yamadazyma tenuis]